jgi:hypothetical protein
MTALNRWSITSGKTASVVVEVAVAAAETDLVVVVDGASSKARAAVVVNSKVDAVVVDLVASKETVVKLSQPTRRLIHTTRNPPRRRYRHTRIVI